MFESLKVSISALLAVCFLASCSRGGGGSTQLPSQAPDDLCPYRPSRTFSDPVQVSGLAHYEYRVNGNGVASDDGITFSPVAYATAATRTYSLELDGTTYAIESTGSGYTGQADAITKLKAAINADTTSGLYAYGVGSSMTVTKPNSLIAPVVGAFSRLTQDGTNPTGRPIRFAEVTVRDSSGTIVQCAETDQFGDFAFELPKATGSHTIEIGSRSFNDRNSSYVLNSPTENRHYILKTSVSTDSDTAGLFLRARVHGGELLGGAFNMLDQILNAQDYLRSTTSSCDQPGHPSYFPECVPFTVAPLVKIYWKPGFSPAAYVGVNGAISYYLNGRREMYIQGGQGGNVLSSDMDHFDNSVILHEYAHFLEDVYGSPNSPGGSHNGDSIIDPRLAWSEGWANFFQAAVTGDPRYRDTYGSPDCSSACAGAYFDEPLDPVGVPPNDSPTLGALGEGNFREFSISRLLWDVIKPTGGVSQFSEIWRVFVSPSSGMKVVNDPFKTVGRFHQIQADLRDLNSWSSIRIAEEQMPGFQFYATPFSKRAPGNCSTSPVSMSPTRFTWDDGSFQYSDQYRSNDFYRFDHTGGVIRLELFYEKDTSNPPDLDFYLYSQNYLYGRARDILLQSAILGDGCPNNGLIDPENPFQARNGCPARPPGIPVSFGYETAALDLLPGTYMINVKADTAIRAGATTNYVILINGNELCPVL